MFKKKKKFKIIFLGKNFNVFIGESFVQLGISGMHDLLRSRGW